MPTAAEELRRLLGEFNERHAADLSMVVSRTGVPIAHEGPPDLNAETFASLAATLMNAAEVMYTGLGRAAPDRIVVQSEAGTLVATGLGTKAMFVALGKRDEILRGIEDMTAGIRSVLSGKA
jgi:predicted regulator of Ras-like GTPase activity (Roadblock/LC7/MglB family)